jgi:transcriptional regulator with XRE-family HTH domain
MTGIGDRAKKARKLRKLTLQQVADAIGVKYQTIQDLEKGKSQGTKFLLALARVLEVRPEWLESAEGPMDLPAAEKRPVLIVGQVGAGAEMIFYSEGQGPFGEAPSIQDATSNTVAVEINGGSLGPLFDHWLAYYDDVRLPPTEDLVGYLCVVGLKDGRVLIKKLQLGRTKKRFDLFSNLEAPIYDVEVRWAAKVKDLRPR